MLTKNFKKLKMDQTDLDCTLRVHTIIERTWIVECSRDNLTILETNLECRETIRTVAETTWTVIETNLECCGVWRPSVPYRDNLYYKRDSLAQYRVKYWLFKRQCGLLLRQIWTRKETTPVIGTILTVLTTNRSGLFQRQCGLL